MSPIPVFMYHHVNPHKGDMVTVTPDVFDAQMRFLIEAGYKTLSADELMEYVVSPSSYLSFREREGRVRGAVAITFDDGYLDNYIYAFPVLKKYHIKATIFIVTDWVDAANTIKTQGSGVRSNKISTPSHKEGKELIAKGQTHRVIMNWDMVREMYESGLVKFYSHTISHRKCAELPDEELLKELVVSKRIIEEKLNSPCSYLCWPKGSHKEDSIEAAKKAGYKALFTTKRGIVKKGSDRFSIARIVVKDDIGWFKKRVRIYTSPILAKLYLSVQGSK